MSEDHVSPLNMLPLLQDFDLPDIDEIVKQDQPQGVACTNSTRQEGTRHGRKGKTKSFP